MNGQQVVEFQDDDHASGTCYAMANLVQEKDGEDILTTHAVRYYDKYVKTSEGWKIAERDQYFVFSDSKVLPKLG